MLGFNALAEIQPLGKDSTILDLEDYIVSNIILPLGSLIVVIFCTQKFGWGFDNYMEEANVGKGFKVKRWMRVYMSYILPVIIGIIAIISIISPFVDFI
jgi:NSS family neurotransmitter:Na+ symporter